jgi:hypothetical protein
VRKLKLELEAIRVDTFDTSATVRQAGTVFGKQCTCYTVCTCPGCPTCDYTYCDQASCNGSCDTCPPNWTCDGALTCFKCNTMETDKQVICCL